MNERTEGLEINLQKLFMAYLTKWWLMVIAAVLTGLLAYGYTSHFIAPMYQASTTIYVNNMVEGKTVESVSTSQLSASQQLVSTYISIVKSDRVMSIVAKHLGNGYTSDGISGMVSAAQVEDTEIFSINVSSSDPEEAAMIANAIGEVVPEVLSELIEGSSARVIDVAKVPGGSYYPSYRRNTVLGAAVGGCIAGIYVTLLFLLDVRIKDEEDISIISDLPVLGQIPEFATTGKATSYSVKKTGTGSAAGSKKATEPTDKKTAVKPAAGKVPVRTAAVRKTSDNTVDGKEQHGKE